MSQTLEQHIRGWAPPAVVGLIVGAVSCGLLLPDVLPPATPSAPSVAATTATRSMAMTPFRRFAVPIALVAPSTAASVITTADELRWTTSGGDFVAVRTGQSDDPFAPTWGTTVTDRGSRTIGGLDAEVGTIVPRRAAESGQIRMAVLRAGARQVRVLVRTSASDPYLPVLADFEVVLASLRVLDR